MRMPIVWTEHKLLFLPTWAGQTTSGNIRIQAPNNWHEYLLSRHGNKSKQVGPEPQFSAEVSLWLNETWKFVTAAVFQVGITAYDGKPTQADLSLHDTEMCIRLTYDRAVERLKALCAIMFDGVAENPNAEAIKKIDDVLRQLPARK